MKRLTFIKLILFLFVVALVIPLTFYPQALSQNFEMLTDVLDSFGGRASSTNFSERIGSGGQLAVGLSEDSNFYAWQGYVHAAVFVHGDCDGDGNVGLTDVVYLINYVLKGGSVPIPLETGDMDCPNNDVALADIVFLINYLFRGGPPPCNL